MMDKINHSIQNNPNVFLQLKKVGYNYANRFRLDCTPLPGCEKKQKYWNIFTFHMVIVEISLVM